MSVIITSIIVLGGIGIISAAVLYVVAKKFHVDEDPRIALVEAVLPGANCGACGRSGCHDFATACVGATSLDGLYCPGAGNEGMKAIADITGLTATEKSPAVAVIRCNGSCTDRPRRAHYDGAPSCATLNSVAAGESDCPSGCLGLGDCVRACRFDAITIDPATGLPVVDQYRCTGCGACTRTCPRHIIELRPMGPKGRRVYVACSNRERGAVVMKECAVPCIGCGKCARTCPFGAITVNGNLAYIDAEKCRLCRKCVPVCPTSAIHADNFPQSPMPSPQNAV
ncbi:MAG: RnfABCDGE type electron transport complex subunit B [Pseudoflavonifractor sp.]|nr:RnfABCDGE type electron transport complex subunit B [Pseudoflavonifractor sp.]